MERTTSLLFILILVTPLWGYEAHSPSGESSPTRRVERLKSDYERLIRPIFKQKCFDCHSDQVRYPAYYRLPGIRQMIDDDIEEAREHLDMSKGFPFGGHHDLKDQLKAIARVVRKNKMPPRSYRLLHPASSLSPEERQQILEWVKTEP